jgi:hypothetical protein
MIKNIPDIDLFKDKDFNFAPSTIKEEDADEYIRQINETTEYTADYCGVTDIIETFIIVDMKRYFWMTKILFNGKT